MATELLEKESDRYWNRSNIMLLIQGALLALFGGISGKGPSIEIAVCVQGTIFSLLWFGVVHKGSHYVERWDRVVMEIEVKLKKELGQGFYAIRHMNDAAKVHEKRDRFAIWGRTTKLMKITIVAIGVFWVGLTFSTPWRQNKEGGITVECNSTATGFRCIGSPISFKG